MRIETIVGLYGKGNEIISWRSLCVGSCFVLSLGLIDLSIGDDA
jgi:hypothetical protein